MKEGKGEKYRENGRQTDSCAGKTEANWEGILWGCKGRVKGKEERKRHEK